MEPNGNTPERELTFEEIMELPSSYAETVELQRAGKILKFQVRMIETTQELDSLRKNADRLKDAAKLSAPPFKKPTSLPDILAALTLQHCCVTPQLNFEQALAAVEKLGPAASFLVSRISAMSGITDASLQEIEEELQEDPFPIPDPGLVLDLS